MCIHTICYTRTTDITLYCRIKVYSVSCTHTFCLKKLYRWLSTTHWRIKSQAHLMGYTANFRTLARFFRLLSLHPANIFVLSFFFFFLFFLSSPAATANNLACWRLRVKLAGTHFSIRPVPVVEPRYKLQVYSYWENSTKRGNRYVSLPLRSPISPMLVALWRETIDEPLDFGRSLPITSSSDDLRRLDD